MKKAQRSRNVKDERDPRGIDLENQEIAARYVKPNFHIQPKTQKQDELIKAINASNVVIALAPAGCGKTYIAGGMAAKALSQGDVEKIVLTRANVHVGKSLGMLPGTTEEKMAPLLAPILSVLRKRMGDGLYAYNMSKKKIEIQALEYIRGMNFEDTFLIIDEAQNLTKEEVIALYTRYESGKILFIGDTFQTDLKSQNGLSWLAEFSNRNNLGVPLIQFSLKDIVRSDEVKVFLTALYAENGVK